MAVRPVTYAGVKPQAVSRLDDIANMLLGRTKLKSGMRVRLTYYEIRAVASIFTAKSHLVPGAGGGGDQTLPVDNDNQIC